MGQTGDKNQGSRLTVANWPQTSKNFVLACRFCASLAILARERVSTRGPDENTDIRKLSESVQDLKHMCIIDSYHLLPGSSKNFRLLKSESTTDFFGSFFPYKSDE